MNASRGPTATDGKHGTPQLRCTAPHPAVSFLLSLTAVAALAAVVWLVSRVL